LLADANGNLFGTTETGGVGFDPNSPYLSGFGTVFEIANNGTAAAPSYASTPTTLVSFTHTTDGAGPIGGLIADANGDLFGTTSLGTLFEIVNNGTAAAPSYASTPITLANLDQTFAGLIMDANGDLFGTTTSGGTNGVGTVFELVNNGTAAAPSYASTPITLVSFTGPNGQVPESSLLADANGNLFGTTPYGGASFDPNGSLVNGFGTVFEITGSGFVTVQPDHWTNTLGGNWSTVAPANWNPRVPTAKFQAVIDTTGSYSVAITDERHCLWAVAQRCRGDRHRQQRPINTGRLGRHGKSQWRTQHQGWNLFPQRRCT
jgi:hypothetical protein